MIPLTAVPRSFPGETIVCLASGPSLTPADVDFCRGKARVLAIKDNIRLAPWADVLYACDAKWWRHHRQTLTYPGPKYALEACEGLAAVLRETGPIGLELSPTGLRTGRNSGYQAINLAVHLGARRIVLLGYDLQPDGQQDHWFGEHPWKLRPCYGWVPFFHTLLEPLKALGVEVLNATRRTALTGFPQVSLEEALA